MHTVRAVFVVLALVAPTLVNAQTAEPEDPAEVGLLMHFDDAWTSTGVEGVFAHRATSATLATVTVQRFERDTDVDERAAMWSDGIRQGIEQAGLRDVEVSVVERSDGVLVRRVSGLGPLPTSPEDGWTLVYGVFAPRWFGSITVHTSRIGDEGLAAFDGPARTAHIDANHRWQDAFAFDLDIPDSVALRMRSAGVATFGRDDDEDGIDEIELLVIDPGPPEADLHDAIAEAEGLILSLRMHEPRTELDTWDIDVPGLEAAGSRVEAWDTEAGRAVEIRAWSLASSRDRAWITLVCVPSACEAFAPQLAAAVEAFRWMP